MIKKCTIALAKQENFRDVINVLNEITEHIKSQKGWSNYRSAVITEDQRKIFNNIVNSENKVFVAKLNDEIVGLVNMQIVNNIRHGWKRAHLEEVIVKKEYRRKGIGSKMLSKIINYCKINNIKTIKLMCGKQLKDSLKFYKKNGFKFLDEGLRLKIN